MNDSTGKGLLVHVSGGAPGEMYFLADAASADFMGSRCIRGTYWHPSLDSHWLSGRTMCILLDNVLLATEYESPEAYRQAIARWSAK